MAARAEVAPLAGGRQQIIVPAGIAVNAHKVLVRVTAIDKTLDYALFDRALKPARIAQFLRVALRALPQRTRPRVAGRYTAPRRGAPLPCVQVCL